MIRTIYQRMGEGRVLPMMAYTRWASLERDTFFSLKVYERVRSSLVEVSYTKG